MTPSDVLEWIGRSWAHVAVAVMAWAALTAIIAGFVERANAGFPPVQHVRWNDLAKLDRLRPNRPPSDHTHRQTPRPPKPLAKDS